MNDMLNVGIVGACLVDGFDYLKKVTSSANESGHDVKSSCNGWLVEDFTNNTRYFIIEASDILRCAGNTFDVLHVVGYDTLQSHAKEFIDLVIEHIKAYHMFRSKVPESERVVKVTVYE